MRIPVFFASFVILSSAALNSSSAQVGEPIPLSDKASIDCTKAGSAVAKILCGSHEGATADWDLNSTLWAVAGTLTDAQQNEFDQDQDRWRGWLNDKCTLRPPYASDISLDQQRCVINEFHSRAAKLRSQLTGDALTESTLSPEQHEQIQELLIAKGLLQSPPDGEFGNSTRQAIRTFQGSAGVSQTGFLSHEQMNQLRPAKPWQPQPPTPWQPYTPPVAAKVLRPVKSAEVSCTGPLSNPLVRAASEQAVAEMRRPNAVYGLSESGVRNAVLTQIRNMIYERSGMLAQSFADNVQSNNVTNVETCLPGLMSLMADVRKSLGEQNRAAAAAAVEAAKPENQLYRAYQIYAFVKYCNEIRQGYLSVYVNEVEMDRAREKIEGIEKDALAAINNKEFDTNALFKKAANANTGVSVNNESCHSELGELFKIKSSTGGIVIEKDF